MTKKDLNILGLSKVYVFGELFGGEYPHNEVKKDETVQAVQTGVYYSPNICFCAFDIQIEKEGFFETFSYSNVLLQLVFVLQLGNNIFFLDYKDSIQLFQDCDLFYAQPLFIGSYEDCISYNIVFDSSIPTLLGLPSLKNNKAEGIVVKPMTEVFIKNNKGVKSRAIVKIKAQKFLEVIT